MTSPVSSLLKQRPSSSCSQKVPILQAGDSFSLCLARSLPQLTAVQAISPCISCRRGFPCSTQIKCTVASHFWEQSLLWQEMPLRSPRFPPAPTSSHQQPPGEAIFSPKATREEEGLWGGQVEIRCHSGIARRKKIKKGVGRRSLLNSCSLLSSVQLLSS